MMPGRYEIAAAALLAVMMCGSAAAQPAGLAGTPYPQARAMLIKAGFEPVPLKHSASRAPETYTGCFEEIYKPYPEALNCSGTGVSAREFVFFSKTKNQYLIVITTGEEKMTVRRWKAPARSDLEDIKARR